MKQISVQKFSSECGKIHLFVDSDTALGSLHDFLMFMKGFCVDKMVQCQKEELKASEVAKSEPDIQPAPCEAC